MQVEHSPPNSCVERKSSDVGFDWILMDCDVMDVEETLTKIPNKTIFF